MKKNILEEYVEQYNIFLDTGAVLNENFLEFWKRIEAILREKKRMAIMLEGWAKELLKQIKNHEIESKGLAAILSLCESEQFVIKKAFPEKKALEWYSRDNSMIVIVNPSMRYDESTIREVQRLNMRNVYPKIRLFKINESGGLEEISEQPKGGTGAGKENLTSTENEIKAAMRGKNELEDTSTLEKKMTGSNSDWSDLKIGLPQSHGL